jgi:hypothetical protein
MSISSRTCIVVLSLLTLGVGVMVKFDIWYAMISVSLISLIIEYMKWMIES